jgi:hypothetical protein
MVQGETNHNRCQCYWLGEFFGRSDSSAIFDPMFMTAARTARWTATSRAHPDPRFSTTSFFAFVSAWTQSFARVFGTLPVSAALIIAIMI